MPQDHTGVNISQAIQSILESWALPENKLAYITTDNGSNVIAAVEILKLLVLAIIYIWELQIPQKMIGLLVHLV